jgi:hypothetical protein
MDTFVVLLQTMLGTLTVSLIHTGKLDNALIGSSGRLQSMMDWQRWTVIMSGIIDRFAGQRAVDGKWVSSKKIDRATGKPCKYKAGWVAQGFKQIEGIDYNKLFAAVAHRDSI